jgi:hypothetical protein
MKNRFITAILLAAASAALLPSAYGEDAQSKPAEDESAQTKPAELKKPPELDPALKRLEQLKAEFQQTAKGDEKTVKLESFLTEAVNVGNAFMGELKYEDAIRAVNSARPIAIQTKSEQLADLNELGKEALRKKTILNRIDGLLDRFEKNKTDKALAKQIVEAYLLELDAPAQATITAAESGDPELIKRVGQAVVEPSQLTLENTIEMGDWYAALAKKPGPGKAVATERAMQYYQAAQSAGISDEKVKKRVSLAIKGLTPPSMAGVDEAHRNNELTAAMAKIFASLKQEFQPPKGGGWWNSEDKRNAVQAMLNQQIPPNTTLGFQGKISKFHYSNRFYQNKFIVSLSVALPDVGNRRTEADITVYILESEIPKFIPGAEITARGSVKRINLYSDYNDIDFGLCKVLGFKPAADMMLTK